MTAPEPLLGELARWAAGLRFEDLPRRVTDLAKSQLVSQLAAIRAGLAHPLGGKLVRAFGGPLQPDPARAACVLAGLGSWLNLDDTAYAGHLSNSTVAVPLAYARERRADGRTLLAAVVAANECAARVTAAATLGPFRGQTAAHTSLVGGVAGRLHGTGAAAREWVRALGLALTMPPWTLMHGFLGGEARVLSAYTPVRMAMDACDAAGAGVTSAPDVLEHPQGFLARFAAVPLPEAVTTGLGSRWHTDTLSFKVRPGGPGVDSAVDCALEIRRRLAGAAESAADSVCPEDVTEVIVETSFYTMHAERLARAHDDGPRTPASVLPLSVPYAVATALVEGDLTVADFTSPATDDSRRWRLAKRVRLVEDPLMTRDLWHSEAPFGEALRQAAERGPGWLQAFAGPERAALLGCPAEPAADFRYATKHTGARVTVRLADGRSFCTRRDIPLGAAGPDTRARHRDLVREKFLATGGKDEIAEGFETLEEAGPGRVAELVEAALGDR
ncbi:VlmK-like protein [Streptomyces griseoflavus]|uniref:MmgE/PrpD family protein n=1 Tax=Streptomyces rimosus TaxID=1927 RepID=UPI0004CC3A0F|nr:MmgE/PrpD family protein [Streptomyces rimosus]KOG64584.1 VlmK-like protein [Streptomyces griseoflavus]